MIDWDGLVIGPCQDAFGDPTIVYSAGQGALTIAGVFDRAYLEQQPLGGGSQMAPRAGSGGNVTALRPVLGVQLSQFASPPRKGDSITIPAQGLAFTVQEVRPDGKGWALLLLTNA